MAVARTKTPLIRRLCRNDQAEKSFSPLFPSPAALPWLAKRWPSSGRMFVRKCSQLCCPNSNVRFFVRPQFLKKKKKNVVEIQHNIKVIIAGAQMTTGEVTKEE